MKSVLLFMLCIFTFFTGISFSAKAQQMRTVASGLHIPWELTWGYDDHIWFTQRSGVVCRLHPDNGTIDTLLVENEVYFFVLCGMLGMAFHPDFPNTPYVYIAYNYRDNSNNERLKVARYEYNSATHQLGNRTNIIQGLFAETNLYLHFGCRLMIDSNYLYITTGDAGNTSLPQDLNWLNGKILRVHLDGTIPSDNPFQGSAVWSYGHRNPQGLVKIGDHIFSSEHGENSDDELNIIRRGRNYGWPNVEGYCDQPNEITFCNSNNVAEPAYCWNTTVAPSGIAYYGNHASIPDFQNSILVAALRGEQLAILKLNNTQDSIISAQSISTFGGYGRLRDVCVSPTGRVFVSTSNSWEPIAVDPPTFVDNIFEIYDTTATTGIRDEKIIQRQLNISPNPSANGRFTVTLFNAGKQQMRYTVHDLQGRIVHSGKASQESFTLNMSGLKNGIYFIKIACEDGGLYSSKLLVY
jgi:glucose/arabinose dehydrogenase